MAAIRRPSRKVGESALTIGRGLREGKLAGMRYAPGKLMDGRRESGLMTHGGSSLLVRRHSYQSLVGSW
jgi:hypothetical protein